VSHLLETQYGFTRLRSLWDHGWGAVPAVPGIYAFVAVDVIELYGLRGVPPHEERFPVGEIKPAEVIYVGTSGTSLRGRINNHRNNAGGAPYSLSRRSQRVAWILSTAKEQKVDVDVYFRGVAIDLQRIDGLPIDLRAGGEAGLIHELRPKGNKELTGPIPLPAPRGW
jgi:hypothetical protein